MLLMKMIWKGSVLKKFLTVTPKSHSQHKNTICQACPSHIHCMVNKSCESCITGDDPLHHLIKSLYDIYEKPIELMWDGTKFGIPNIDASFFLTYSDTLKTTVDGENNQGTPKWIDVKSHVQGGGYECGYYVMHWICNIVSRGLKNDCSMWFGDGTALDIETITTIRKKWAAYFVKVKSIRCRKV
ncbi:hypothetical protein glysoja_047221 [Glycine soja]|uniref:Ubiquitin-like protease family profile domain-containing protein n=1 Tax=Glycine soja TaxID=3848 RepID=A0A0B2RQP0_GLYSO|nr:hypothetical protein glysoja_047221 [Glycine soja]